MQLTAEVEFGFDAKLGVALMQMIGALCGMLIAASSAGFGSAASEADGNDQSSFPPAEDRDLLGGREQLFPLSAYYGVCATKFRPLRATISNGMLGRHNATVAQVTVCGGDLVINVGRFSMIPGTEWRDIAPTSTSRLIQMGTLEDQRFVLVTDFEETGRNMVSISYDDGNSDVREAALELANNVVACHLESGSTP